MSSIVCFSPVRVEPAVAGLFTHALGELDRADHTVAFRFTDDNDHPVASEVLAEFLARPDVDGGLLDPGELTRTDYRRDGVTHTWSASGVDRVTAIKNHAIARFLETDAEHLFLVDADVILPPDALTHLVSLEVPIVSAVYWTRFGPSQPWMPNVWDVDNYSFRDPTSVTRLREPGHHRVGGLGACTLLSRAVLEAGVDFRRLPNLGLPGEDRHFCVRAAAHGFDLLACTCVTPFHVYRSEQVDAAVSWVEAGSPRDWFRERWLTPAWERQLRGA